MQWCTWVGLHRFTIKETNYQQFPVTKFQIPDEYRTEFIPGQVSEIKDCPGKCGTDGHLIIIIIIIITGIF